MPLDAKLPGLYIPRLVTLSVLIAIFATYAALDLVQRTLLRRSAKLNQMSGKN